MSDGDTWDCDKCTFVNSVDDLTCTMCYQVRSSTRALPYTWQWLAQVDWIPYDGPSNEQCEAAFQAGADKVNLSKGWFESKKGEYTVHFGRRQVAPAKGSKAAAPRRGAGAAAAAAPVLHSDNDDDGDDPCDEGEDGDSSAPAAAASAAVSSAAPATVAAYTQVNNHSRMVRKVRRLANDDMEMFVLLPPSAVPRGDKCSICSEEWWENEEVPEPAAAAVGDAAVGDVAASPAKPVAPASASAAPAAASSGAAPPQTCLTLHPSDTWPDAALSCVKLVKCAPGHSFHRDCIAQWIKLKDKCPYCANKI